MPRKKKSGNMCELGLEHWMDKFRSKLNEVIKNRDICKEYYPDKDMSIKAQFWRRSRKVYVKQIDEKITDEMFEKELPCKLIEKFMFEAEEYARKIFEDYDRKSKNLCENGIKIETKVNCQIKNEKIQKNEIETEVGVRSVACDLEGDLDKFLERI